MFDFFKKKKAAKAKLKTKQVQSRFAGNTKIAYEPNLIAEFENEHKVLVDRFVALETSVDNGEPESINAPLTAFAKILRAHLLKENLKLYVYLKHVTAKDPANSDIIVQYQREMQGIGKVVNDFVSKYSEAELNRYDVTRMSIELAEIKIVLLDRIENEESILYPLYMSPDSYS